LEWSALSTNDNSDSTPRSPGDYFLFALAFIGFVVGMGGMVLSSPFLASTGVAISLLAMLCFLPRSSPED